MGGVNSGRRSADVRVTRRMVDRGLGFEVQFSGEWAERLAAVSRGLRTDPVAYLSELIQSDIVYRLGNLQGRSFVPKAEVEVGG